MRTRGLTSWVVVAAVFGPGIASADVAVNVNIGVPPAPPIVLPAPPQLVLVPGVPAVHYAPALSVDLFFHDSRWYYPHGGFWYVGRSYRGPWAPVAVGHMPPAVLAVPVRYYKIPPGHLRHGRPPGHRKGPHKD
jgi:hypothetical protein